jgi:hypothetical protein
MLTAAEIEERETPLHYPDKQKEALLERAAKAEQQRDELLRVLKRLDRSGLDEKIGQGAAIAIRAALAKIEGENNAKG